MAHDRYEAIAASQTAQVLGATGAIGDVIRTLIIVPATTAPGAVSVGDGDNADIPVYTGGTVGADLTPIVINFGPDGIKAVDGGSPVGWDVTTGANVSVIAIGRFTD